MDERKKSFRGKEQRDISFEVQRIHGYRVRTATITNNETGKLLGRAAGKYHTIEIGECLHELMDMRNLSECLAEVLRSALEPLYGKRILLCGLGNADNPADSLGPEVTRFMPLKVFDEVGKYECRFAGVSSFAPGITMSNNIRTEHLVKSAVEASGAEGVVLIDSVATEEYSHLFRIIDVSTAGGITSHLAANQADWSILGVPIITIGVPTAIPGKALFPKATERTLFTESRISDVIMSARTVITYALLRVCWPDAPADVCYGFARVMKDPTALLSGTFYDEGDK